MELYFIGQQKKPDSKRTVKPYFKEETARKAYEKKKPNVFRIVLIRYYDKEHKEILRQAENGVEQE